MKAIGILSVILIAILACGDDESGLQNSPPVIDHVVLNEPVEPGASVELQVVAHDADGDVLSYVWEAKEGKLDSSIGRVVKWTAPTNAKSAIVVVHANDGVNESAVKSKKISINLENSAPVIKSIVVPDKVHAGARIQLRAITDDADGDTLTYNWEVEAGILNPENTSETKWTAPVDMGFTKITLTVDDGINEVAVKSAEVRVIHSLIVAGQEAAGIRLGDEFDRVRTLYGKPDGRNGDWFSYDTGLSGFLDGIGLVDSLFISKPNTAKTADGNGIGSALKRVDGEFGPAEEIKEGGKKHWHWKTGIHFDYDAASKVERIYIFKPIGAAPSGFVDAIQQQQVLRNKAALDKYYSHE